ncbi:caspase, EACC1-associated type [Kitasatospora purpeofusca]|uniref:caspase, EACC1-associated type n=1 Tax=Kitasatospora purpeofusca TaxID=67352 RepID=UPI002A5A832B|nr:caspase family protein [Kitasatospora purpeofusca]MDY0812426.1 caspase family protein [Kitasatospora purpeofusca]
MRLPDPLRSRIVLVGASTYTDPDLPDLPAVRRTVADLAALFTDPDHGVVPEEHCTVLLDDADLSRVGRRLREAARAAEDLLLVYFTGHGLVGGRRHDLYLALPDSEYGDPDFTSLEYDKLRGTVLNSRATTKIIVLDCCFSGRAVTGTMAGGPGTINQLEVAGTYVLTSAQRDQVALSPPGEDHTAFSGRLIRLLREGVAGGPEYLTIDDLYQRLAALMLAEGLPVPLSRATENASLIALGHNRIYADHIAPALRERQVAAEQQALEGDWAGAAASLQGVLEEQTRLLGAEHEDTLRCRRAHAHCVGGAGDPAEAARLLRPLPAAHARLLGKDHEETLHTRQFLAVNLGEACHRAEAIAVLRVLLADRSRLLGSEHEDTLRTRHMLARNLALTGAEEEATALLRQLVAERDRVLGTQHPHTVRARKELAVLERGGRSG